MTTDDRRPLPPLPPPLHPDLDTLADLHAGVLDASTAERVRAHAGGCRQCTAALAALDAVGADLRSLPAPALPPAVAARLDATLADLRSSAARPATPGRGAAAGPGAAARSDTAGGPASAADPGPTAAGTGSTAAGPGSTGAGPASTGAGAGPVGAAAGGPRAAAGGPGPREAWGRRDRERERDELAAARERRRRRSGRTFGAVAATLAVFGAAASVTTIIRAGGSDDSLAGGGGTVEQAPGDAAGGEAPATLGLPQYDRGSLRADLPQIVQQSAVSIITGGDDTGRAGVMADTGRRTACANTIGGRSGELSAVQRIEYEGRPAYVFVFSADGRNTAYVVSDDCGTSAALPASVLDTVS